MKFPSSTIFPSSKTNILSAFLMVESLCAIIMVVLPLMTLVMAACILLSVLASKAEVASSRIKIGASFKIALAMLSLCFSPPESLTPLSPIISFSLFSLLLIRLQIWAFLQAFLISSSEFLSPFTFKFSKKLAFKKVLSWKTMAIFFLKNLGQYLLNCVRLKESLLFECHRILRLNWR